MLKINTLLEPTKGLAFCFVVGSSIFLLNKIFTNIPFDTLLFALIAGILFRNIFNKSIILVKLKSLKRIELLKKYV